MIFYIEAPTEKYLEKLDFPNRKEAKKFCKATFDSNIKYKIMTSEEYKKSWGIYPQKLSDRLWIRLSIHTKRELKKRAQKEQRTLSDYCRIVLEDSIS